MPARVLAPAIGMIHEVRLHVFGQSRVVAPRIRSGEGAHMRTVQRVCRPERYHILGVVQTGIVALRTRARLQHSIAALLHGARKFQPVLVKSRFCTGGEGEELISARPKGVGLRGECSASFYRRASLIHISLARGKAR